MTDLPNTQSLPSVVIKAVHLPQADLLNGPSGVI